MAKVDILISATDEASKVIKRTNDVTNDLADALTRLVVQERNNQIMKDAEKAFANLTRTEKKAALEAYDAANAFNKTAAEADEMARANKQSSFSFTELKSAIDLTGDAFRKIGEVAKVAMEMGRRGAEINFVAGKFDRLAVSVGTTSDALRQDLHAATKGMITDADLMASAGDLMSLGLAKTADQTVRLTKVASALDMDMNQLVLALSNQTTMRFDQLNVSVDGFDERLKMLIASGMDANAAFTEAFLQQAEQQVKKLGERADSGAAAFDRMDVAIENMKNHTKQQFAPLMTLAANTITNAFIPALDAAINKLELVQYGMAQAFDPKLMTGARIVSPLALAGMYGFGAAAGYQEKYKNKTGQQADADRYYAQARAAGFMTEANKAAAASFEEVAVAETFAIDTELRHAQAMRDSSDALRTNQDIARNLDATYRGMIESTAELSEAQANWNAGAGGDAANALQNGWISAERYREGLGAIDEVMGTQLGQQEDYNRELKAAADEYRRTGDLEAYKTKLTEIKDTYQPLEESIKAATEKLEYFRDVWDSITSKTVTLRFYTPDGGPTSPGTGSRTSTGGYWEQSHPGGGGYAAGLDMTVPAGYMGDSYHKSLNLSSGERLLVLPSGRDAPATGGGISIANLTVIANNPRELLRALEREATRASRSGARHMGK